MNSEVAVSAENVSKRFVLQKSRAGDLRELFTGLLSGRAQRTDPDSAFYALRDVGFSIRRGETVGIVGHNGSGKSTLLKMLTGILQPDTGQIRTQGRIGALIEVGAGFHPDLSGRENVFLNGSIMGLSRRELEKKFDAIVAFAGLERFIDTPVKRYSSGMYMRLGFAIATHIDPEILLIDEVLAVGDTQFQNKCIKHLRSFAASGGTVIFVSHAMDQVAGLCERCLWLDRGLLLHDGPTTDAIDKYLSVVAEREDEEFKRAHPEEWKVREEERRLALEKKASASDAVPELSEAEKQESVRREQQERRYADPERGQILSCRLSDEAGKEKRVVAVGDSAVIKIEYKMPHYLPHPVFGIEIFRADGLHMFSTNTHLHGLQPASYPATGALHLDISSLMLNTGSYKLSVVLFGDWHGDETYLNIPYDDKNDTLAFDVDAGTLGGFGCVYVPIKIRVEGNRSSFMPVSKEEQNLDV